jgi:probable rRNA maturation factor
MGEALELDLTYAARRPWVPGRAAFLRWTRAALAAGAAARPRRLSIRIVGEAGSLSLNERYRRKARATNVLSFAGAGTLPDGRHDLGELVICAPLMAREAARAGIGAEAHWAHITVHGVLHLLGHDHEADAEARRMQRREAQILGSLGFSNPYR